MNNDGRNERKFARTKYGFTWWNDPLILISKNRNENCQFFQNCGHFFFFFLCKRVAAEEAVKCDGFLLREQIKWTYFSARLLTLTCLLTCARLLTCANLCRCFRLCNMLFCCLWKLLSAVFAASSSRTVSFTFSSRLFKNWEQLDFFFFFFWHSIPF